MGIRSALRMRREQQDITAALATTVDPSTFPIASPWSSSDLQRIVFEDIFGGDIPVNTRSAAMKIPAISRGRNLICSSIARMPLGARNALEADTTPAWFTNTRGASPQHRLLWTVDDLIFYGWSCWKRENNADGFPGIGTERVNQGDWSVNADGRVEIHGIEQRDNEVILISGFHEGILTFGKEALSDARDLYTMVRARLKLPFIIDLHQTDGADLTPEEIDALIDTFVAARMNPGKAGVGYTSKHIEAKEMGLSVDQQLMIEGRNASSLDLARVIGVSAGMLDATVPKASLNYETTSGRNNEFVDRDLQLYMEPIRARLSQDDVMPHGQRAIWDLTDYTAPVPSPTGPALQD